MEALAAEVLGTVQARLKGDPLESYGGFIDDQNAHVGGAETRLFSRNACR